MFIALTDSPIDFAPATASLGPPAVRSLLHDVGENDRTFGQMLEWDVVAAGIDRPQSLQQMWYYEPLGEPQFAGSAVARTSADIFVVFNNVVPGNETAAEKWYRDVHIPETFEHFGFTAGWRFVDRSAAVGLRPSQYAYLTIYGVAPGKLLTSERSRLALASERAAAAARGAQPTVPVPDSIVGPRYAQYYSQVAV